MTTTVRGAGRARHEGNRRHQQRTVLPPKPPIAERPELNGLVRPLPPLSGKAAQFATAIGAAGWKVSATVKGATELVTATRGAEIIDIGWKAGKHQYELTWYSGDGKRRHLRNGSEALKVAGAKPTESPRAKPTPPDTRRKAPEPRAVASTTGIQQPRGRAGAWKPAFDGSSAVDLPFGFDGSATEALNGHATPAAVRPANRRIPFASDAPIPEILAKVNGKKITWLNSISQLHESGIVMPNAKSIQIMDGSDGRRTMTFPVYKGPIRTVDLARLISVR